MWQIVVIFSHHQHCHWDIGNVLQNTNNQIIY